MRRRLRRQSQVREALLLDLGALVFELHRQGRREPELLQAKAAELLAVDEEVRSLDDALGAGTSVLELTAAGIAGSCSQCEAIMPLDVRYCSSCGAPAQVALGPALAEPSTPLDPPVETPPLPPQEGEATSEIPTEERAALEAGDFEQADPGPPVGDVPLEEEETFLPEEPLDEEETFVQEAPLDEEETFMPEAPLDEEEPFVQEGPLMDAEPLAPPVPKAAENGSEEPAGGARGWLKRRRDG